MKNTRITRRFFGVIATVGALALGGCASNEGSKSDRKLLVTVANEQIAAADATAVTARATTRNSGDIRFLFDTLGQVIENQGKIFENQRLLAQRLAAIEEQRRTEKLFRDRTILNCIDEMNEIDVKYAASRPSTKPSVDIDGR
jgi:ABC-type oligopeptide transport system substrate-binding subunit